MTTRSGTKYKGKKSLETTLGKAPVIQSTDEQIDLSHVRKPIETSIFGLKQVLSLFETATDEVQRYVAFECDIIYECRMCRTIFRSLANFILHKRNYCRDTFASKGRTVAQSKDMEIIIPSCKKPNEAGPSVNEGRKDINSVIERLQEKQKSSLIAQDVLNEDLSNESLPEFDSQPKNVIALEEIKTNESAVFQTMFDNMIQEHSNKEFMKSEVMEVHGILQNDEAVLGADGKVIVSELNALVCSICHQKFLTRKMLTYHLKCNHNKTKRMYACTDCKETFPRPSSVIRHLYKEHQKSIAQVRKLRERIHSNVTTKETKNVPDVDASQSVNEENQQWINNIESDNDFQMCGGCGRRFERKAALHSHSRFCTKRIAVCNNINKENKRNQLDEKQVKTVTPAIKQVPVESAIIMNRVGAEKRKPLILRKNKIVSTQISKRNDDLCRKPIILRKNRIIPSQISRENNNFNGKVDSPTEETIVHNNNQVLAINANEKDNIVESNDNDNIEITNEDNQNNDNSAIHSSGNNSDKILLINDSDKEAKNASCSSDEVTDIREIIDDCKVHTTRKIDKNPVLNDVSEVTSSKMTSKNSSSQNEIPLNTLQKMFGNKEHAKLYGKLNSDIENALYEIDVLCNKTNNDKKNSCSISCDDSLKKNCSPTENQINFICNEMSENIINLDNSDCEDTNKSRNGSFEDEVFIQEITISNDDELENGLKRKRDSSPEGDVLIQADADNTNIDRSKRQKSDIIPVEFDNNLGVEKLNMKPADVPSLLNGDLNIESPSVREMVMEVIFGNSTYTQETQQVNERPVRNRVKNLKKDFLYATSKATKSEVSKESQTIKKRKKMCRNNSNHKTYENAQKTDKFLINEFHSYAAAPSYCLCPTKKCSQRLTEKNRNSSKSTSKLIVNT